MDSVSNQHKYYLNNREKVLAYKKEFYADKIKKYAPFKNLRIRGVLHPFSTKLLKHSIDNDKLLIYDNNEMLTRDKFIELYSIDIKTKMNACIMNDLGTEIKHLFSEHSSLDECFELINNGNYLILQFDNFKKN